MTVTETAKKTKTETETETIARQLPISNNNRSEKKQETNHFIKGFSQDTLTNRKNSVMECGRRVIFISLFGWNFPKKIKSNKIKYR